MRQIHIVSLSALFAFIAFSRPALGGEAPSAPAPATAPAQQPAENITLDIKGMDILDVLKILAVKSGLNIVAGKNVTGKVTIFLKDVNVWDALEIVLVANNLAYEKQGNIINVMTDRDYELIYGERFYDKKRVHIVKLKHAKAADVSRALAQLKTNLGKVIVDEGSNTIVLVDVPSSIFQMRQMIKETDVPVQTKVFSLQYAKAEDIEKKVSELVTKNLGTIRVDARTNKIVISDRPDQMTKLADIIAAFDQKDQQVMIEAKILDITLSDEFKMGVDWDVIAQKYFKLTQSLKTGLTEGGIIKIGTIVGGGNPQVMGDYSSLIDALRTVGKVNVLSAPRIMTINNQESKILVGTKEAYITSATSQGGTGTTVTSQSVNFVDTGIKLYVTPTINEDGFVTMKIKPEISSAKKTSLKSEDKTTDIPIVSTSETETTITVKDGTTVVLGGLIKDSYSKEVKKIPLLGDIPFLGRIFSNDVDIKEKREIVILLTPHLVSGEHTFDEAADWNRKIENKTKEQPQPSKTKPQQGKKVTLAEEGKKEKREINKERELEQEEGNTETAGETEAAGGMQAPFDEDSLILRVVAQKLALQEAALAATDDYDNYFFNMKSRIQQAICKNFGDIKAKGRATAFFIVVSDGKLKGEPVITDEDDEALGDVLLSSIKMSSPFVNFPASFNAQEDKFIVTVDFK